jgi:uncharacterized protein (DUF58 family)
LTATGIGTAVVAVCCVAVGLVWGYAEFVAVGAVGALLLVLAFVVPRVVSEVQLERVVPPRLVGRGDVMHVRLAASAARPTPPAVVIDQMSGVAVPIGLPRLRAGERVEVRYGLRALRRGVHQLGPLLEERADPLSMLVRTVDHDVTSEVLVHPRITPLTSNDAGSRVLQNRARLPRVSDDPLADFRSLREYVVGDDERLVHWPTVARTGTLMVRDHFELRRTTRLVVLETLDMSIGEAAFEDAVEIAASLVCDSLDRSITVSMRSRDAQHPGRPGSVVHRTEALEYFARVRRTTDADTLPASRLRLAEANADQIVLVAGDGSPLIDRLAAAPTVSRHLVVVRIVDPALPARPLRVRSFDVQDVDEFSRLWHRAVLS